ncbi:MAG: PASTA domain-containing protein [Candidatus Aminicenantes bacterium]|nr:PASTA domain-containing protein [Candidatus Aminicenantes bacterium]
MVSSTKINSILFYVLLYLVLFFASADVFSQLIFKGELINLPDLTGRSVEEARALLAPKKIGIATLESRFDTRLEKGRILSQDPAKGSRIKPRRTVSVVVSLGNEQIEVPKLEGRSLEMASQVLKTVGLRRGRVSQIHASQAAAGRILAQNPPSGSVVNRASAVDFLVSRGTEDQRYIMPDLIAKNSDAVLRRLRAMDFLKVDVGYAWYPDIGPGVILKQGPIAGSLILKRNQIHIEVSR